MERYLFDTDICVFLLNQRGGYENVVHRSARYNIVELIEKIFNLRRLFMDSMVMSK